MVVHLTFPPAAVYHTSKMHCHEDDNGSQQRVCVTRARPRGVEVLGGRVNREVKTMTRGERGGDGSQKGADRGVGCQDLGA